MSLRQFASRYAKEKGLAKAENKYNAKSGNGFPSQLEGAVDQMLRFREKAGEIRDIRRQQVVILQDGPSNVKINWKLDFSFEYCATGELVYVEAKGVETETYQLKLKLWRKNPPARLEIWKGRYRKGEGVEPILVEEITPEEKF